MVTNSPMTAVRVTIVSKVVMVLKKKGCLKMLSKSGGDDNCDGDN